MHFNLRPILAGHSREDLQLPLAQPHESGEQLDGKRPGLSTRSPLRQPDHHEMITPCHYLYTIRKAGPMRTKPTLSLIAAAVFTFTLTACEGDKAGNNKPQATQPTAAAPTTKVPQAHTEPAVLPDMTGKGLQSAQDQAQAAGFYNLHSHDALGRGRAQALDRNWKVCGQTPAAGEHPSYVKIDFATVKLEETCPTADQGADEPQASSIMPNFAGKSVKVARQSLDTSTSLTVTDASPEGRMVLLESNWKVCTQEPTTGTKLDGQPVTLTAVKFEESC